MDREGAIPVYRLLRSLKRHEKGATAIEYGLILALVVVAVMSSISMLGKLTGGMWNNVSNQVTRN